MAFRFYWPEYEESAYIPPKGADALTRAIGLPRGPLVQGDPLSGLDAVYARHRIRGVSSDEVIKVMLAA